MEGLIVALIVVMIILACCWFARRPREGATMQWSRLSKRKNWDRAGRDSGYW